MTSGAIDLEEELLGSRYRVISDLGSGAFGRVVQAQDTLLERRVAIKIVPMGPADRAGSEVLVREARAASAAGPAAVLVHDVISSPRGVGIVMELVARGSLLPAVRAGTPARQAYDLGRAAVESMALVHAAGVLHQDLHPGNLLVRGDRSVAVADFGLAMFRQSRGFSRGGHELFWTAPELLEFGLVSPQADVFALGLVLRWIQRRSAADFGPVVGRATAADRRARPSDAGQLLDEIAPAQVDGATA